MLFGLVCQNVASLEGDNSVIIYYLSEFEICPQSGLGWEGPHMRGLLHYYFRLMRINKSYSLLG
jgi:hypothetical protein